jgi:cysteine desulfurase
LKLRTPKGNHATSGRVYLVVIERYFDNAATTPVDPRVLREMLPFLSEEFGNAHSIHQFGRKAMEAVELARQRVADLIEAEDPSQVVFTSGATESNNWILRSFPGAVISPFEHSSLFEPGRLLGCGVIDPKVLLGEAPRQPVDPLPLRVTPSPNSMPQVTQLISVMAVNNELGTMWDVREFRPDADLLHTDATQALGKVPFSVDGIDYASFSSHKLYGPKGIGALYLRGLLDPLIAGGEQEHGVRGGTLNVPGIVGFGAAAAIAQDEMTADSSKALECRNAVLEELNEVTDWRCNGGTTVSPYILSVSFLGVEGETLVIETDAAGYAISAGAACSSRSTEPSHVLRAAGIPGNWARGTIRISIGRFNTVEAARGLGRSLARSAQKLRTMS